MTSDLHRHRLDAVLQAVRASNARSVLDLGCGDGDFLVRLAREPRVERIVGIDISEAALARLRPKIAALGAEAAARVRLARGSMLEAAPSLVGFDCAVLVETIEHVDPPQLSALERTVFAALDLATIIVTTPNADFNPLLGVPARRFRHPDHRFEWGRARFRRWAEGVAARRGYTIRCADIGGAHPDLGGASQMAVFSTKRGAEGVQKGSG